MLVHFEKDGCTARLEGRVPTQVLEAVHRALTYIEPNIYFSPAYKFGRDDGKRFLFDLDAQEFPAGLERRVLKTLDDLDLEYGVEDERPVHEYDHEAVEHVTLNGVTLYKQQITALHGFFAAYARGCMELPTSYGKTEVASAVLKLCRGRALVLMDSKSLMSQTAQRLHTRLSETIGVYGGGEHKTKRRITCATIQSVWRHLGKLRQEFLPSIETLIVDECHRISPHTWHAVLRHVPAFVRLGLSATIRSAAKRMVVESYIGPIVHESSVMEMIEDGRAAKPTIRMLRLGGAVRATEPQGIYEEGVVYNQSRNRLLATAIKRYVDMGKPALGLVVRIDHGYALQKMLADLGLNVPFLHGKSSLEEIDDAKRRFGTRYSALLASTIFNLGQDIPAIKALVIAGGQRSPLVTIQRVGRSLRNKPDGENTVEILDVYDMSCRMLQNQSDERLRTYRSKYGNATLITDIEQIAA